jgi:hypothetical protein
VLLLGPDLLAFSLVQEHELACHEAMGLCVSPSVAVVLHFGLRFGIARLSFDHFWLGFALDMVLWQTAMVRALE